MSTRGYLAIKKNGKLKGMYNHFDSYPSGLGEDVIQMIQRIPKDKRLKKLNDTYDYIQLVKEDSKPTKEQQKICKDSGIVDLNVSSQSLDDWYCLLRKTQGDLRYYFDKVIPYMLNGNAFFDDPLFCEWSYIINLDTNKLEVYEGEWPSNKQVKRGDFDLLDLHLDDIRNIENYY